MKSYSWNSHPARERPVAAAFVLAAILTIFYYVYDMTGSPVMVLVAVMIFIVSLSTFFFPTRYTVDEKQVTIKYLYSSKERNLSAFRTIFPGRRGVLLSPFLGPSRLENYRGFYLRYSKDNKEQIDMFLKDLFEGIAGAQTENAKEDGGNGS
ncbi:MAG: hypothetical protein V3W18_06070 [candidate division Zixibacteria bacterium]